jgi:hypothetical protein
MSGFVTLKDFSFALELQVFKLILATSICGSGQRHGIAEPMGE